MKKIVLLSLILIAPLVIAGCDVKQLDQMDQNNREKQVVEEKVLSVEEKERNENEFELLSTANTSNVNDKSLLENGKQFAKIYFEEGYNIYHDGDQKLPTNLTVFDQIGRVSNDLFTLIDPFERFQIQFPKNIKFTQQSRNSERMFIEAWIIDNSTPTQNYEGDNVINGLSFYASSDFVDEKDIENFTKNNLYKTNINDWKFLNVNNKKVAWIEEKMTLPYSDELNPNSLSMHARIINNQMIYKFTCNSDGEKYLDYIKQCKSILNSIIFF